MRSLQVSAHLRHLAVLLLCGFLGVGPVSGNMLTTGVGGPAAGGAYTGPGDVVSGASAWYGVRAYNKAYATGSNPSVTLVDQAGANSIVINILSTGFIDIASINAWVTAHSVTTIKITKFWDQSGNANHLTQATLGFMPVLALSSLNGLPALQFTSANTTFMDGTAGLALAPPMTLSTVFKRTGSTTTASFFVSANDATAEGIGAGSLANTSMVAVPTAVTQAANDNVWHSLQGVGSATVGAINTDGTDLAGQNTGGNTLINVPRIGASGAGVLVDGLLVEAGYWAGATTATQRGNISTNQHSATSGYNF